MYIWEIARTTAGDVGIMRVKSGHLQSIEGDRIANPTQGDIPKWMNEKKPVHGVITNPAGRVNQYIVNTRKGSGLIYEKTVQAHNLFLHNYSTRIDQWRGVSPLSAALNTVQDLYETLDYSVLKAKAHAFFGMIIKSDKPEVNGGFIYGETDTGAVDAEEIGRAHG